MLILIVPSVFLLIYAMQLDPPIRDAEPLVAFAKSDPRAIIVQVLAIIPVHILTLLLAWAVVTRMRTYTFREMLACMPFVVLGNLLRHDVVPEQHCRAT